MLDRFDGVIRQPWVDGNLTTHATSGTLPNIPPIVEIAYSYDKAGNRTKLLDGRPGAKRTNRDVVVTNDDLHRLTQYWRGVDATSTAAKYSQSWTYDHLGNWNIHKEDGNGDGDYGDANEQENRDHNLANEVTGRDTDNDQSNEIDIDYDLNGNTTCVDPSPGGVSPIVYYTYDGWNRLVKVEHEKASQVFDIAEYEYNALHQRIIKRSDEDVSEGGLDHLRLMYYSPSWQLLEERIDDNWSVSSSTIDRHLQYIYGVLYIDDLVLRRQDSNVDGDFVDAGDKHWYHLTDPQFSSVAILDPTASVVEEVTYDAFGRARHHQAKDLDGDGDFDATDRGIITTISGGAGNLIGQANYRSEADLDRDGDVDSTDLTLCGTNYQSAIASCYISDTWGNSGTDNTHGWSGYYADRETKLYHVRFRYYDTVLMRWINRDPAGYQDSMNLYGYGWGNAIGVVDPFGLSGNYGFASGAYVDRGGYIGFDPSIMRGMTFLEKVAAGWYDDTFYAMRMVGVAGLATAGAMVTGGASLSILGTFGVTGTGAVIAADMIAGAWSVGLLVGWYQYERGYTDWGEFFRAGFIGGITGGAIGQLFRNIWGFFFGKGGPSLATGVDSGAVTVSRWGRSGLEPGDWVMLGRKSWWNYMLSFKWQPGFGNKFAPYGSGQEYVVPRETIRCPSGWEWFKWIFRQRRYWP